MNVSVTKRAHIARNRDIVLQHLLSHPCVDCGQHDLEVLEFDHVRGRKLGSVAQMAGYPVREERLRAEIAKCEVRCVNCHRRRSSRAGRWWSACLLEGETSPPTAGSSEIGAPGVEPG